MFVLYLSKVYVIKHIPFKNIQMECGEKFDKKVTWCYFYFATLWFVALYNSECDWMNYFQSRDIIIVKKRSLNMYNETVKTSSKSNRNTNLTEAPRLAFSFLPPVRFEIFITGFSCWIFIFRLVQWLKESDYSSITKMR